MDPIIEVISWDSGRFARRSFDCAPFDDGDNLLRIARHLTSDFDAARGGDHNHASSDRNAIGSGHTS